MLELLRVMFPYMLLVCLAAVFMAWLYLGGRLIVACFAVSATRWRADEIESGTTEAT